MSSLATVPTATSYRTAPSQTETGFPPGVPYIIGNEAAERFSFYGMRVHPGDVHDDLSLHARWHQEPSQREHADGSTNSSVAGVFYLPFLGAFLSDGFLGKYRTILYLSIVYCFGHFALGDQRHKARLGIGNGVDRSSRGGGRYQTLRVRQRRRPVRREQQPPAIQSLRLVLLFDQRRLGVFHLALSDPAGKQGIWSPLGVRAAGRADVRSDGRLLDGAQQVRAHPSCRVELHCEDFFNAETAQLVADWRLSSRSCRCSGRCGIRATVRSGRVQAKSLNLTIWDFTWLSKHRHFAFLPGRCRWSTPHLRSSRYIPLFNLRRLPRHQHEYSR